MKEIILALADWFCSPEQYKSQREPAPLAATDQLNHRNKIMFDIHETGRPEQSGLPFAQLARHVVVCILALCSVGCKTDQSRCGLNDLCHPVVGQDPFPDDVCVPPKGVDPLHFGYTAPRWSVIQPRQSSCCSTEFLPFAQKDGIPEVGAVTWPEDELPEPIGSSERSSTVQESRGMELRESIID